MSAHDTACNAWHRASSRVSGGGESNKRRIGDSDQGRYAIATLNRSEPPTLHSQLVEAIGARYVSTKQMPLLQAAEKFGAFDLIFEAAGVSSVVFEGLEALGRNGALVLTGISGGNHLVEVPGDRILLGFVLGNKVTVGSVNANRVYFERGVLDMALAQQ